MSIAKESFDMNARIALIGNYSVGKSSFLRRYIDQKY